MNVVSRNNLLSETVSPGLRKLSRQEVFAILRALARGDTTVYHQARIHGVSPQWIREIRRRARLGLPLPGQRPLGRPRMARDPDESELILAAERHHRLHPLALERLLDEEYGVHIAHNRLWTTLKGAGLVVDSPKKQHRRKWVRFERRHSNSLWQMDYSQIRPGDHLFALIDDASRLLVGWVRTPHPTAENAWKAFETAGERYGFPKQLLSDHGTQFTKIQWGQESYFDRKLRELRTRKGIRVQHILSRVKHPQTGGKVERVFGTLKTKLRAKWPDGDPLFDSLEELIAWYNEEKPHLSLNFERAETPLHAFVRKLPPKAREEYLRRHPEDRIHR
jgi:putative transposase